MREVLALIPARSGSRRVPGKNIRKLGAHPLVAYTICAATRSQVTRVILSTNDPEIASVARSYGAEVPFLRPVELATDTASSLSVIRHALRWLEQEDGYKPDLVAYLSPTSPFRSAETIDRAVDLLLEHADLDSVVTITRVAHHPYFVCRRDPEGYLHDLGLNVDGIERSQDLPPFWCPIHAVFVNRPACLWVDRLGFPCFNPENVMGVEIDRVEALDIDTMEDFQLAEMFLSLYQHRITSPAKVHGT